MFLSSELAAKYHDILLEKKGALIRQVERLAQDAAESTLAIENSKSPQFNSAENAAGSYEQDFAFISMESEEDLLRKVDRALERVRENNYGQCEQCGQAIQLERLEAVPWATMCVKCQAKEEEGMFRRPPDETDFEIVEDNETALISDEMDNN